MSLASKHIYEMICSFEKPLLPNRNIDKVNNQIYRSGKFCTKASLVMPLTYLSN